MGGLEREFGRRQPRNPGGAIHGKILPQRTLAPRVLVFFGSKPVNPHIAGEPIPPSTPFDQIHKEMLSIARKGVDVVSAWQGAVPKSHQGDGDVFTTAMKTDKGIDAALKDIFATAKDASMKVIVYGYSLGGTDALELSRKMDMDTDTGVAIKIRLLITVDAAVPFSSEKVNRRVGSRVARNFNFFQLHQHFGSNSRGGPNTGASVTNIDRSFMYNLRENQGHILIQHDTAAEAIGAIRREFFSG